MSTWKQWSPEAKARDTERRKVKRRMRVNEAAEILGGFCEACGNFDPSQLQFHHKDPSIKEFDSSRFGAVSRKRFLEEIRKCGLLCKSCHTTLHQYGPEELKLDAGWLVGDIQTARDDSCYLSEEDLDELF